MWLLQLCRWEAGGVEFGSFHWLAGGLAVPMRQASDQV